MKIYSKHTPAPWRIEEQCEDGVLIVNTRANTELEQPVCLVYDSSINLESEANTNLIVAAPELLEVLSKLAISVMNHPDYTGDENHEWTILVNSAADACRKASNGISNNYQIR